MSVAGMRGILGVQTTAHVMLCPVHRDSTMIKKGMLCPGL